MDTKKIARSTLQDLSLIPDDTEEKGTGGDLAARIRAEVDCILAEMAKRRKTASYGDLGRTANSLLDKLAALEGKAPLTPDQTSTSAREKLAGMINRHAAALPHDENDAIH